MRGRSCTHLTAVVVGVLVAGACNGRSPIDDIVDRDEIAVRELASGYQGPESSMETVVRERERLAEVWPEAIEPPSVDFEEEQVVVVALGRRPTGGYGVQVTAARVRDGTLVIEYVEREPGPGCLTTQALTAPYQIVAVPTVASDVEFRRRVEASDC